MFKTLEDACWGKALQLYDKDRARHLVHNVSAWSLSHPLFSHAIAQVDVPAEPGQYGVRVHLKAAPDTPLVYPIPMEEGNWPGDLPWCRHERHPESFGALLDQIDTPVALTLRQLEDAQESDLVATLGNCKITFHSERLHPDIPVAEDVALPYLKYLLGHRYVDASCLGGAATQEPGVWFATMDSALGPIGVARLHTQQAFAGIPNAPRLTFINYISTAHPFRRLGVAGKLYQAIGERLASDQDFLCRGAPAASTDIQGYERREGWLAEHCPHLKVVPYDLRCAIHQLLAQVPLLRADSDGACWRAAVNMIRCIQQEQSHFSPDMAIDVAIARLSTLSRDALLAKASLPSDATAKQP